MSVFKSFLAATSIIAFVSTAHAQATRTWVSGVGDDVNPCSRTAPCKTFAGAISKTAVGGEISVLDPGGFGPVNITKSITIDGAGTLAGILALNTNGVIVNGPAITVTLRNFSINGADFSFGVVLAAVFNFLCVAAAIYFLVVVPLNKLAERRAKDEPAADEAASPTEVELLTEIRDALKAQNS